MSDNQSFKEATSQDILMERLMDCSIPKTELEYFAAHMIAHLFKIIDEKDKNMRHLEQLTSDQMWMRDSN